MRKNIVFTPLMSMLVVGGLSAQDTSSAVLTGRVTSQNDQPLQGVRVLLESPALLGNRQVSTGSDGYFRVPLLPNGEFTITFSLNGYITRKMTMRLIAGQTSNASTRLTSVGAQEVTVEITTTRNAQVDKTDTVVQTTFSSDYLEAISGRGLGALGRLAPGINTTDLTTDGNLRIRGGTGHSTKALVNGMTVTEQYRGYITSTFNMSDLIESVSVIQSPINARYGNSDGGIITMVTSKGSNTFTGTFRANVSRSNWGVNNYTNYPRRDGTTATPTAWRTNDELTRSYELTVQGPIWKDHITFAYGANLTPTTYGKRNAYIRWYDNGNGTFGRPQDSVGTYFMQNNPSMPGYGDVIRKAEMYSGNDPYNRAIVPTTSYSSYNQFTVYAQITPSHQLEWNYSQRDSTNTGLWGGSAGTSGISTSGGGGVSVIGEPWDKNAVGNRSWNISYKGIIATSGVLELRYGKTYNYVNNGFGMGNPFPIRTHTTNSYIPINPNGDRNDPNNYWANGLVEADARSSQTQWLEDPANFYNPLADYYFWTHNGPTQSPSASGSGGNTGTVLNYQHFLNTDKGSHLIDFGMQRDKYNWQKPPPAPMNIFYAHGHIAIDLKEGDIWNSRGNPSADPSAYADKFIVYDVTKAWLSDISPWGVARYKIRDMPVYNPAVYPNRVHPLMGNADPRYPMVQWRFGESSGEFLTNMTSFYLNDLWSINDRHSIQGGLRVDNFELVDGGNKALGYTQPTVRFEYKWDLHGDQSRLLNVSWGQFHTQIPTGTFRPMIEAPGANTQRRYWTTPNPDGSNRPYLVSRDDIINLDNYGELGPATLYGGMMYRVDPDWKAPISTELSVGFRRNLSGGGNYRATFAYRTWINDFDFYPEPSEIFQPVRADGSLGQWNIRRYMRNTEGYTRTYTGIELEWEYPIHRRATFGGSYTYSRLRSNVPSVTDAGGNDIGDAPSMNFASYWDYMLGGRDKWAATSVNGSQHIFKFYLLFDLTSGNIKSSVSFTGNYNSGGEYRDVFSYNLGFPVEFEPEYRRLIVGTAGGTVAGTAGTSGFSSNVSVPVNLKATSQDSWDLSMRYLITAPLARKISWLATIVVSNPFNHRGLGGFSTSSPQGVTIPKQLTGSGNPTNPTFPYGGTGPDNPGVWLAYYDTSQTGLNTLYSGRMNGRSFTVQTGLRF